MVDPQTASSAYLNTTEYFESHRGLPEHDGLSRSKAVVVLRILQPHVRVFNIYHAREGHLQLTQERRPLIQSRKRWYAIASIRAFSVVSGRFISRNLITSIWCINNWRRYVQPQRHSNGCSKTADANGHTCEGAVYSSTSAASFPCQIDSCCNHEESITSQRTS